MMNCMEYNDELHSSRPPADAHSVLLTGIWLDRIGSDLADWLQRQNYEKFLCQMTDVYKGLIKNEVKKAEAAGSNLTRIYLFTYLFIGLCIYVSTSLPIYC